MSELTMKQKGIRALLKAVDGRPQFPFGENMTGNPALTDDDGNPVLPVYRVVELVLDAALGDEPLYRRSKGPCVHGLYVPHRHVLPIQGREEQCEGGRFVQVNPEGEQR